MNDEIIYCQEPGDGSYSFHKVVVDGDVDVTGDRMTVTVGPWEKDSQWTDVAFNQPINVALTDDGDRVRISGTDPRDGLTLDYSQVQDLIMLLDAYRRCQRHVMKFKRFQEVPED